MVPVLEPIPRGSISIQITWQHFKPNDLNYENAVGSTIDLTFPPLQVQAEQIRCPKTLSKKPSPQKEQAMAAAAAKGGRFRELLKKYGKVALGVHFSVSAVSITGLYIAIKNNVDVESLFDKWHLPGLSKQEPTQQDLQELKSQDGFLENDGYNDRSMVVIGEEKETKRNRTAELVASTGGALTLAVLCNKALFPIRVPITIAVTPPLARFLARRGIIKNGV